jgi:hypothetical protein
MKPVYSGYDQRSTCLVLPTPPEARHWSLLLWPWYPSPGPSGCHWAIRSVGHNSMPRHYQRRAASLPSPAPVHDCVASHHPEFKRPDRRRPHRFGLFHLGLELTRVAALAEQPRAGSARSSELRTTPNQRALRV